MRTHGVWPSTAPSHGPRDAYYGVFILGRYTNVPSKAFHLLLLLLMLVPLLFLILSVPDGIFEMAIQVGDISDSHQRWESGLRWHG